MVVNITIMFAPAVMATATGKDVYHRFVIRFCLFVGVALYAWFAILILEWLRDSRRAGPAKIPAPEAG